MPEYTGGDFQSDTVVSRETLGRLEAYVDLLARWQRRINLIGAGSATDVWRRHILDCAQLYDLVPHQGPWLDLGSGAGLPGIIVAVLGAPDVHLVEANARKCAFLHEALRATGTAATIHNVRIEALTPWPCAVVSARALATLDRLLDLSAPFFGPNTVGLFPKGQNVEGELTRATKSWRMEVDRIPSRSDPAGTILRITEVRRV